MKGFFEAFIHVTGLIYAAMMTNLLLVVANLPLAFLVVFTDVTREWLLVLMTLPFLAPTLTASFAVFRESTEEGGTTVVRTFLRQWSARYWRSFGVGWLATAAIFVLFVDIAVVWGREVGAVAIPVFAVFTVLLVATTLAVLVAIDLDVDVRGIELWKRCLFLVVRRWYFTAMSLFALALLLTFVVAMPALGLGLATSPLLYFVWTNIAYTILPRRVLAARNAVAT